MTKTEIRKDLENLLGVVERYNLGGQDVCLAGYAATTADIMNLIRKYSEDECEHIKVKIYDSEPYALTRLICIKCNEIDELYG